MALATEVVARRYIDVTADTPISVDIPAFVADEVFVYYGAASLVAVQGSDYTLTLAGDFNTVSVTPLQALIDKIDALIAADATEVNYITVRRTLDGLTEATPDGVRYTPFTSREFERVAMRHQQLNDKLARSLSTGEGNVDPLPPIQGSLVASSVLKVAGDGLTITSGPTVSQVENAESNANAAASSANAAAGSATTASDKALEAQGYAAQLGAATGPLVVVCGGQSNADGAGDGGTQPAETSGVQVFDPTTRVFRDLSYANRLTTVNVNNGASLVIPGQVGYNNFAFSFCHEAHRVTGRTVYLIQCSNGGTHIGRWVGTDVDSVSAYAGPWGGIGVEKPLYASMKIAVEEALAVIGTTNIDAFLWHQGETARPNNETQADYARDFDVLIAQLKAENWWRDDTQFIGGELVIGSRYDYYQEFIRSQNDNGDPFIKTVSGLGLTAQVETNPTLKLHYDGQSLYELGLRYWRAFLGDDGAMARRFDPALTQYSIPDQTVEQVNELDVPFTVDITTGRILENVGIATARTGGGWNAGQTLASDTNCIVTHNADGTFTVQPSLITNGDWSFEVIDTWIEGPAVARTATITGKVSQELVEKFRLWIDDDTSASVKCNLLPTIGSSWQVDWGDGTVDTGVAHAGTQTHTYSSNYTGWVIVSAPRFVQITALFLADGKWRSPLKNLSGLRGLAYLDISASDNKMYGDMADLPDAMATFFCNGVGTISWNLSGLPNLANVTIANASTTNIVNAFGRLWEQNDGVNFNRLTLRGTRTSAQVDAIIIAMADVKSWQSGGYVYLNYAGNAARTSASDAAVAEIIAKGGAVHTTP